MLPELIGMVLYFDKCSVLFYRKGAVIDKEYDYKIEIDEDELGRLYLTVRFGLLQAGPVIGYIEGE